MLTVVVTYLLQEIRAQQQTSRTPLLLLIGGTYRQMYRWKDTQPLHRPCSAHYTVASMTAVIARNAKKVNKKDHKLIVP